MKTLVFDLDGTMYRGTQIIESARQYLDYCIEHKIPFLFLTNNATRTQAMNARHMLDMGYEGIEPYMFYNSAMAATDYVKDHYTNKKAYYIGQEGLKEALLQKGYEITDQDPDFVFVGLQTNIDFKEYSKVLTLLLKGAKLIGTNRDRILPQPGGSFILSNGPILAMFEYATNQKSPEIGKPYAPILDYCLQHYGLKKEDIILVGDNLETDIKLGYDNHVKTIFVQTGVHTKEDMERLHIYPDIVVDTLMDLAGKEL